MSGVISLTESESEKSERFHFSFDSAYDLVAYYSQKTILLESRVDAEERTNCNAGF